MLCYVLSYYGVSIINQSIWKCAHSAADWSSFKSLRNQYHKLILSCKKDYYSSLVSSASDNPKRLWQTVNKLLHGKKNPPHRYPPLLLALHLQRALLFSQAKYPKSLSPATLLHHLRTHRHLASQRMFICIVVSTITDIVNLSLTSGQFHPTLEESVISPLLMKPALDKEELSDYRPMSNLSLISKIIDRVVESRLMDHLTSNSLLNSHQSANIILPKPLFCTSTITSFRTGSQKVSRLCLLDLSGVFDNIDHDTLINRFSSWFGIHGSVLSWFKSYLSSRCFRVKCETDLSS